MQVKFRQTTRNGCGSLSIANIFDDERFTTGLEGCPGERIADLNKKLQDIGSGEIFIDQLFLTQSFFRSGYQLQACHDSIFRYGRGVIARKDKKGKVVPYLISIANSRGRNPHMVAALHSIGDKMFHIIDSTKDKVLVISVPDLIREFHIISVAIFRMWDHPEPGNFVIMEKSDLPHIFGA